MSLMSFLNDVLAAKFPHQQTPEEYQRTVAAWLNGGQTPGQVSVTGAIPGLPNADQNAPGAGMDTAARQNAGLYDTNISGSPRPLASPGDADFLRSLPPQIGMKLLTDQYQQSNSPEQAQLVRGLQMRGKVADILAKAQGTPTQFDPMNISPQIAGTGITPPPDANIPSTPSMPAKPTGIPGFDYGGDVTPGGITPDLINRLKVQIVGAGGDPSFLDQFGPKAPIKASAGDQFLNPDTLQPIASVPKSVEYLEPRPAFNPATGKTGMWQAAKDGSQGKWIDAEPPPPQPEAPLSPERFRQQRDLQAAGKEPGVAFDNPALVEIDDGQGGTKQITAQQNKTSGQWVTADENRTPLNATNLRVVTSNLPGGGRIAGQVIRITTAAHDIASELENISKLPSGASSGLFRDKGMVGTPLGALARTVTSQEVQSYKTSSVGISRALAALEAAGLAPPGSLTNQMEGLQLQEGDSELTKMQKMATVRQQASNSIDAILASPLLSKQQREEVTALKSRMEKAIPWTPLDVINLLNSRNPRATLGDFAKQQGLGGGAASAPTATGPNGQKLILQDGKWVPQ